MSPAKTQIEQISGLEPGHIPDEVFSAKEPLLLKGMVDDWPAARAGKSGKAEIIGYLKRFCRNKEIVVFKGEPEIEGRFFYNEEMSGFNFGRANTTFEYMLNLFDTLASDAGEPSYYIGSTAVDVGLPGFRAENDLALPQLNPLVSIWMGNQTRIAAHFDNPNNIACVAAGRRRFTLFPPNQVANLYVGPLDFTPAGQAISLVDFHHPDFERFPLFKQALANAVVVDMKPGDALFIPSLWWHHVEALDDFNVLVNYWWRSVPAYMGTPMDALIHALLSIKALPAEQKAQWRTLFDHYIFEDNPTAFSHIPEASLGILSDLDEATAVQLSKLLSSKLKS